MYYVSEKTIKRMIKYKGECCISCQFDVEDGYPDWGSELDYMEIGYTKDGRERFAHICCQCSKAFNKWIKEEKRNIRSNRGERK